jgi:metallophosphoesterase superfamily enzyme
MNQWLDYSFGGQSCRLYFDGSIYVKQLNTIFISDLHLGKGSQFRKEGIPTPVAVHKKGMQRLKVAIDRHTTSNVVFLGDLFDGYQNKETVDLKRLIQEEPNRTFTLVKGNHDFDLPNWTDLKIVDILELGDFICIHEPPGSNFKKNTPFQLDAARATLPGLEHGKVLLCGHLHPGATLKGKGRFRVKMKAFFFNEWIGILPAFGALTGHHSLGEAGHYFGIIENQITELGNWSE